MPAREGHRVAVKQTRRPSAHEDRRPVACHERAHARLGRLRRQQDVLRAEPADPTHRGAAHRDRAPRRHPLRRRHARDRRAPRRHGLAAARLSGQPRRRRRSVQSGDRLVRHHAGHDRAGRRRHPRRRHSGPAHRLAQILRRPDAAGPRALLLLPPRTFARHHALDAGAEDQMVRHGYRLVRPSDEHLDPPHAARHRRRVRAHARQGAGRILRHLRIRAQAVRPPCDRRHFSVPQLGVPGGAAARREHRRRYRVGAGPALPDRRLPMESCPCRIVAMLDADGVSVEALGAAAQGLAAG